MEVSLEYDFERDRDHLMHAASLIRSVFWPISVFLVHPFVLFVLIQKTRMDHDCKIAFVAHDIILVIFDVYNGLFYQLYTLLPYPIICCTGILCTNDYSPRMLLTILAFLTIAQIIPYFFVMMRMHQKMLTEESRFKMSIRSQTALMFGQSFILFLNLFGFGAWSEESPEKDEILKIPDISWAQNQSSNFLVLGRWYGDIGVFRREMLLLFMSMIVCFPYYVFIVYHAIFRIGNRTFKSLAKSKTYELQLRFMIAMGVQACFSSIMFILPLLFLFTFLVTPMVEITPHSLGGPVRITVVLMYSCCSSGHSAVFIFKSAWCRQTLHRLITSSPAIEKMSATTVHKFSKNENLQAKG